MRPCLLAIVSAIRRGRFVRGRQGRLGPLFNGKDLTGLKVPSGRDKDADPARRSA